MKKLFAFISLFLLLSIGTVFAEVTAKKLADGSVEVTFFYGNPRATEVLLAGSFNNWQNGAEAMEKGEKGFTLVKTFKETDDFTYKFISDGNWTTDLKAPDFLDDGFGGKNGHVTVSDLVGGGGDAGAAKAKINFVSWTMTGFQSNYKTQGAYDKSSKGTDLESITFGLKSYDKFVGTFLPHCPLYIEIALAEIDMENYDGNKAEDMNYLYRKNEFDDETVEFKDGFRDFVSGILSDPVAYAARAKDASKELAPDGPGFRPFLGHFKFGFDTPIIKTLMGFNYAKPDVRNPITWTTITSNWDAGYTHVGGFVQFSLGDLVNAALGEAVNGLSLDIGFAPNKSADRKGTKFGYWAWAGVKYQDFITFDFQTNGMYNGRWMFYDPVEHDFILGAKGLYDVGPGKLSWALDWLFATHQKDTKEIIALNGEDNPSNPSPNIVDYFGYSTDVWYRSGDFDGIQNMAGNIQLGYKMDLFNINLEYRLRGVQASMLFVRENHDDGTFDLSSELGVVNSQRFALDFNIAPVEPLNISLNFTAEMPLQCLTIGDEERDTWYNSVTSWWKSRRFIEEDEGIFDRDGGAEIGIKPAISYNFKDAGVTLGAYVDMAVQAYKWTDEVKDDDQDDDDLNKYGRSRSIFCAKRGGLSVEATIDNPVVKGVKAYYGFDLYNKVRFFNTLAVQVIFPDDLVATVAFGIKSRNTFSGAGDYDDNEKDKEPTSNMYGPWDSDTNNPFSFALGIAKRFKKGKKPTLYGQFVWNMDPFKKFGDGQDNLNMDRANIKGSWQKEGSGKIDPVDWYDGRAALRVGCRWDI